MARLTPLTPAPGGSGLNVKVTKSGRVRGPNLDYGQLTLIGETMVKEQKKRWSQAINAEGNQAKPLSKKYLFIKKKYTRVSRPTRDNKMTGALSQNFTLRRANDQKIRAENTARGPRQHAQQAQKFDQMIGFAGSDQIAIFKATQGVYGQWLQKAWVPLG